MDKIAEYESISKDIQEALSFPGSNENHRDCTADVKILRNELVVELETNNSNAIDGINGIPDETLRKYIEITRSIRAFWFDNVDTHLLTIERLSDQILCRRRAYERSRKDTTKQVSAGGSTKAIIEKAPVDKTADLIQDIAKLKPEDIQKLLSILGQK